MKKEFALLVQGRGEGCDHTIACNRDFAVFFAKSDDAAMDVARKYYGEMEGGEPGIKSMILLEVVKKSQLDLDELSAGVFEEPEDDKKVVREATKRILAAEKRYASLERKFDALKRQIDEQAEKDHAAGEVLAVVKQLSGRDAIEVAKQSGGNLAVVAGNLLFEAVQIKAAQMKREEMKT